MASDNGKGVSNICNFINKTLQKSTVSVTCCGTTEELTTVSSA